MRSIPEIIDRPLVSVAQAAALAGLSKSVAYRLAAAGVLPGLVRLPGARLLVRRRVLEAWLAGSQPAAPAEPRAEAVDQGVVPPPITPLPAPHDWARPR